MATDDQIYGAILLCSIPYGLIIRVIKSAPVKEFISAFTGLFIILAVCREHSIHFFVNSAVNTAFLVFLRRNRLLPAISFIWSFTYIAFFRTCHWFGVPQPSPHSNAVQLILTLRLVSIASEVAEMENLKNLISKSRTPENIQQMQYELEYKSIKTSLLNIYSYYLNYMGILTGPFYTCRTHQDMLQNQSAKSLPLIKPLAERLKSLPICAGLFLALTFTVSNKVMMQNDFYKGTTWYYRYGYLALVFIWFKTRMFTCWLLAECMMITAGLGAYPAASRPKPGAGPTHLAALEALKKEDKSKTVYNFETIHNIMPYEVEFATTFRATFRYWNMTVQWWLVVHVYKKLPFGNKFMRGFMLMLISAFWHGVHPGYYATFLSAPFFFLAEDSMYKGLRSRLTDPESLRLYDRIASFIRMRFYEYMSVGMVLLQFEHIWRFYQSIYFFGHFLLLGVIVLGMLLSYSKRSPVKLE